MRASRRTGATGFTLVEVTLTLLIVTLVLGGVLALLGVGNRVARAQASLAGMQQALRIAQYDLARDVRMTGRGPLLQVPIGSPSANRYDMLALALLDNVDSDQHIAAGNTDSPEIVEGTDVLTIRGVFTQPLYQVDPTGAYALVGSPATGGTLAIDRLTPTGIPQDLRPLADAIDDTKRGRPEALLVVSPLDDALYAVVELGSASSYSEAGGVVTRADLAFDITGGSRTAEYGLLSAGGSYPEALATAAFVGILEEYRYYVRHDRETPGNDNSRLSPHLSRARLYPGTEVAHLEDASNLVLDVADNVLDLQIALGIDTQGDEIVAESEPPDGEDDWLFNSDGDDATEAKYATNALGRTSQLYYIRLNTLVRTDHQDRGFEAEVLGVVEDRNYSAEPDHEYNTPDQRAFHRRWVKTVVDARNIP